MSVFYLSVGLSEYLKFISGYFVSLRALMGSRSFINCSVHIGEVALVK